MVSPQVRREQIGFACELGCPSAAPAGLLGIARSTLNFELILPAKDAPVIAAKECCLRSTRATTIDGSASSCAAKAIDSACMPAPALAPGGAAAAAAQDGPEYRRRQTTSADAEQRQLRVGLSAACRHAACRDSN